MVTGNNGAFEVVRLEGAQLECRIQGEGEPVLFVHGAIIGDAFGPLLTEPLLADGYQLIQYHRRGFEGSSRAPVPFTIGGQAGDALALLDHLGIERVHLVGHSYGGSIAIQVATDARERVHSLALLEPAMLSVPSAGAFGQRLEPIVGLYQGGDAAGAIEAFLEAVAGPGLAAVIDGVLDPNWFKRAVADADTFFRVELPALAEWSFTREDAAKIRQPVLSVLGERSATVTPHVAEVHALLQEWMPQTKPAILPGATHALQMMNPHGMAQELSAFFARHPIEVPTGRR